MANPLPTRDPGLIGIAAPASAPRSHVLTTRGLERLSAAGLKTRQPREHYHEVGYLAGSDAERAIEINALLRDPEVRVIMCARGGYGSMRILERVDYAAAKKSRPVVVGYSDITALQLALLAKADIPSLSGPMVAVEWGAETGIDRFTHDAFWTMLFAEHSTQLVLPSDRPLQTLVEGSASGRLIGGNLAVLTHLVGTPYLPDMDGAILFIEEIGESPYRVDGYLAQLRLAGILDQISGVMIGDFTEAEPAPGRPTRPLEKVFGDYFESLGIPVVTNLAYGHVPRKTSVPIGVKAELKAVAKGASLTVLEPVMP